MTCSEVEAELVLLEPQGCSVWGGFSKEKSEGQWMLSGETMQVQLYKPTET
jgi:hypothetical protein